MSDFFGKMGIDDGYFQEPNGKSISITEAPETYAADAYAQYLKNELQAALNGGSSESVEVIVSSMVKLLDSSSDLSPYMQVDLNRIAGINFDDY